MPATSPTKYHLYIKPFQSIVGKNFVFTDELTLNNYAQDQTEDLLFPPDIVIKPKTTEEIAAIMKICNA